MRKCIRFFNHEMRLICEYFSAILLYSTSLQGQYKCIVLHIEMKSLHTKQHPSPTSTEKYQVQKVTPAPTTRCTYFKYFASIQKIYNTTLLRTIVTELQAAVATKIKKVLYCCPLSVIP